MADASASFSDLPAAIAAARQQLNTVILGKPREIDLCLACLFAAGHLLLEDLPGVGKTTLAHALAATLDLTFSRVQFTPDLLPTDLIGVSVYRRTDERFEFHPGPIFTQLLLGDELNRGTPKTQSALLEAMAEQQVTVDGQTHPLPRPFFVIATQNPLEQAGTFPLPESQLDRFLMGLALGYPGPAAERALLESGDRRDVIAALQPKLGVAQVIELQRRVGQITASPALLDYVQALLDASRREARIRIGLSPRAGLALLRAARARALIEGRNFCQPEDVQAVFVAVAAHRLVLASDVVEPGVQTAQTLLRSVPVP